MSIAGETRAAVKVETIVVEAVTQETNAPESVALGIRATFEQMAKIADLSIPVRRPRKVSPSTDEKLLREEMEAWDAASDEALQPFDNSLEE